MTDNPHGDAPAGPPSSLPVTDPAENGATVELTVVTMAFEVSAPDDSARLAEVLAKYVVLSRGHPGCRNIDLCASMTTPGRLLIIEKWDSPRAQRVHFDSDAMVEMARACRPLLAAAPAIDLLDAISAHDLA
jgi:quinol monooxygenase YgiN